MMTVRMGTPYVDDLGALNQTGWAALKPLDSLQVIEGANAANAPGDAPRFFPRAWVSFAGATGDIQGSGNVASVTRSGAGEYVVNFTTNAPNINYAPMIANTSATFFVRFVSRAVGSCGIETRDSAGVLTDPASVSALFIW